ncbi:hypothetical protein [Streptomyces sp. SID3212]|uniref:hypothetical protein n=1 Tax=Streptomyces sp. SID3212 TaxID=2690259 RepID=UPI00136F0312|nr:hypothetical protein [Streptomyces sp. SID3212]MYV53737.1 hypothetical protein [Streptomyces sp. SID3212]
MAAKAGSRAALRSGSASVDTAVYLSTSADEPGFVSREHAERVVTQWGEDRPGQATQVEEMERKQGEVETGGSAQVIRHEIPDRRMVHHTHALFLAGLERLNVGRPARWSTWALDFESDLYTDLPVRWHNSRRPRQGIEAHVRGTDEDAVSAA